MQTGQGRFAHPKHLPQRSYGSLILALEKKTVSGFTPPSIGILQTFDELDSASFAKSRRRRCLEPRRRQPPDAATVASAFESELGLDVVRDRPGMLDHFTVHIHDVQGAIRSVDEIDGPKPGVGRGHEFRLLLATASQEGDTLPREDFSMNEVAGHIAKK